PPGRGARSPCRWADPGQGTGATVDPAVPAPAGRGGAGRAQGGPAVTVTIGRLRWWHIDALAPIEADLFGAERWSAAMFWNELANGHYYVVALEGERSGSPGGAPGAGMFAEEVVGYAGLSVGGGEGWVQNIAVRRNRQRRGIGRALLEALLAEADRRKVKA